MEKIKQVKPEDVIAYNAGVVKYQGRYVMVCGKDYNWNEEEQKAVGFQIGVAYSDDRISNWRVHPKPIIEFQGGEDVRGSYDPRVTILDGRIYITYAMYTNHGYRGTIAVTDDFEKIE